MTSTMTPSEYPASALMSAMSPVRTVPPGSAIATTIASTADPGRARLRISAARRAVVALTDESTMHVSKKRSVFASRLPFQYSDSTSTIVGTTGGQSSWVLSARMSVTDVSVRAARRDRPPLSSTSTSADSFE